MMKKGRTRFYGQAGEYYVLFRLWESGIVAMTAPPGAARVDLLLYDSNYHPLATVQVKSRSTKYQEGWIISRKQALHSREKHFYIFVELDINPVGQPASYVVPSVVVADIAQRVIDDDPSTAAEIGEQNLRLASDDSNALSFSYLKSMLQKPHPKLGTEWQKGFENAYELLTMPLFRSAASQLAPRRVIKN